MTTRLRLRPSLRPVLLTAVALAATAALSGAAAGGAPASGHGAGVTRTARPVAHAQRAGTGLGSPADTGASDMANLGTGGWAVQSSAVATQSGATISKPGFNTSSWLPVASDDAGAPGTEVEALAANGMCPGDTSLQPVNQSTDSPDSVYYSDNMKLCYGSMSKIGAGTVKEFDVPWWWQTDFTPGLQSGQYATLIVNGVVGTANVWLNGTEVATSSTVTGDYTKYTFSVTSLLLPVLLREQHRRADRADEEHGAQHDPARGPPHAQRLLRADGPGRHPGQRRVPVL